jgi:hypothetical protein
MGLLSKLLNPLQGPKDVAAMIAGKPKAAPAAPAAADPSAAASSYGDPTDPAYGSLTQPFDAEQFYKYEDPGYWFRQQQGQQAVQNRNAAGSGALSGAAYKDLIDYNQGEASTEYGNAFNRYQTQQGNIFQRLLGIAGLGQSAAAGVGNQGVALAGNAGQAIANAGTAEGAGIVGGANAITNGGTNAWLWNSPAGRQAMAGTGNV